MNAQLLQLLSSVLFKQVAAGIPITWLNRISGTKGTGIFGILFGIGGYLFWGFTVDSAAAWIVGGVGLIFLRKGQEQEAAITRESVHQHLNEQDEKLDKAGELLKTDVVLNLKREN